MNRFRSVNAIYRDEGDPSKVKLLLSCGHEQELENFPLGTPPPCFKRECREPGCPGERRVQ